MAALCDAISSGVRALRAVLTSARVTFLRAISVGSSSAAVDMVAEAHGLRPKGAQRAKAVGRRRIGLAWCDGTMAKARNSLAEWSIRSWRAECGQSATRRVERRRNVNHNTYLSITHVFLIWSCLLSIYSRSSTRVALVGSPRAHKMF